MTTLELDVVKEAFYRTFSGAGELWFSYFSSSEAERRESVQDEWEEFLEHVKEVQEGRPCPRRRGDPIFRRLLRDLEAVENEPT